MHYGMIGAQTERSEIGRHRPIENPRLLQDVTEIDVSIQEGGVQLHSLTFQERKRGKDIDLHTHTTLRTLCCRKE